MATVTSFKIVCPSCETSVTIKNPSLVGKKIDCPKCKYRFVVEAPADLEADEEETDAADKKPKKGGKGKKKGAKAAVEADDDAPPKKKNTTLLIGLGLGGVAILLLVVAVFTGIFDGDDAKSTATGSTATAPKTEATAPAVKPEAGPAPTKGFAPGIARDVSNLLPNDAQWVASVDVPATLQTVPGSTLFDGAKPTAALVTDSLGFKVDTIERIVAAGGGDGKWSFTVIRTRTDFTRDTVKKAVTDAETPEPAKTIKSREYFLIKDNPLFWAVGNYVRHQLTSMNFKVDLPTEPRVLTACVVDSRTLIVADQVVMESFLNVDGLPRIISNLTPAPTTAVPTTPGAPGVPGMPGITPPGAAPMPSSPMMPPGALPMPMPRTMSATGAEPFQGPPPGPTMPPGGMPPGAMMPPGSPGSPGAAPAQPRVFTTVPSYRTVEPALKAMLNQMEADKKPVINFAIRLKTSNLVSALLGGANLFGGKFKPALPPGQKGGDVIPDSLVVGFALNEFTAAKFNMQIASDLDQEEQAKEVKKILQLVMPMVVSEVIKEVGFPVKYVDAESNNNNNGTPGSPGMAPPGVGMPPPGVGGPSPGGMTGGPPPRPNASGPVDGAKTPVLPLQGPPPSPGGPPPGPRGPGGMPMPGMPSPGMPGMPGMPGGTPGFPGGTPGFPGGKEGNKEGESTITLARMDHTLMVTFDFDWKKEYPNTVAADLRNYFDSVAGRTLLMGGRHPWQKLPAGYVAVQRAGKFPRAAYNRRSTAARMGLPFAPEQRISWMAELLPALGYGPLYGSIEKDQGWNSATNLTAARAWIPEFLDASQNPDTWRAKLGSIPGRDVGATHFVGLSGIGEDSADLPDTPEFATRLGVFGYDRETSLADIQKGDGLSNTIFMAQVAPNIARPWIRGGGATVAGVSDKDSFKPFNVMHGDGEYGSYVLMADGSVRFVKPTINDGLFKAMVTYKGGDKIDGIDAVAAKTDLTGDRRLRNIPVPNKEPLPVAQDLPKDWQPLPVRVYGSRLSIGMPPGRIESLTERDDERIYNCKAAGSGTTFAVYALHKGYGPAEMTDQWAADEIGRFTERNGLKLDGAPAPTVNLGPAKGFEFKARPQGGDKPVYVCRQWLMNGTRFVMAVSGDTPPKQADVDAYFKSATYEGPAAIPAKPARKWVTFQHVKYGFHMEMPGDFNSFPTANTLSVTWPKNLEGGASLSLTFEPFKFSEPDNPAKVKADLEAAVKAGQFGDLFRGAAVKAVDDKDHDNKPGVRVKLHNGDIPYHTLILHNNRETVAVLKVRANDLTMDPNEFFKAFQFGLLPEEKKDNAGGGGVPPGMPPGGIPGMPPPGATPGPPPRPKT